MTCSKVSVFVCLLAVTGAQAATPAQIDEARAKGLAWLIQHQRGDGSFAGSKGLEVQATAAAVEAMAAGGASQSPQYARALSWLGNVPPGSLDAQAWQIMALTLAGRDAPQYAAAVRNARSLITSMNGSLSALVAWGSFPGYAASLSDTALGYAAVRSAGLSDANDKTEFTKTVECLLLPAQLAPSPWTGSWSDALPQAGQPASISRGSVLATALVLHELKTSRLANRFTGTYYCGNPVSAVDTAINNAKTWLIAQANMDGGFAERNPQSGVLEPSSPSLTALAVRALALFTDTSAVVDNARGWLVNQQGADGNWQDDPFVVARVLAALPTASGTQVVDSDLDGLPDVIEQKLGTQVLVADAQGQVSNGANSVPGVTTTAFSVSGVVNQSFSYSIVPGTGGNGPYAYTRTNGALPPGLTLVEDGTISGVPTTLGSFAFDYTATDAGGAQTLVIGLIEIVLPGIPGDLNGDGIVDVADVALLQRALLGLTTLTPSQAILADLAPVRFAYLRHIPRQTFRETADRRARQQRPQRRPRRHRGRIPQHRRQQIQPLCRRRKQTRGRIVR